VRAGVCSVTLARPAAFEPTALIPIHPALVRRSTATGVRGGAPVMVSGSDTPDARSFGAETRIRASAVDGRTNTASSNHQRRGKPSNLPTPPG
jgi:hypothetical protein